jgi:hypothetical protein
VFTYFLHVGSPYLRQLLTAGPEETMDAVSTVILLPDFPAEDFNLFLKLLCTGIYRSKHGCESGSFRTTSDPVFQQLWIQDPGFEFFPSRIQGLKDSVSLIRIRINEFKYFNPKNSVFKLLEI